MCFPVAFCAIHKSTINGLIVFTKHTNRLHVFLTYSATHFLYVLRKFSESGQTRHVNAVSDWSQAPHTIHSHSTVFSSTSVPYRSFPFRSHHQDLWFSAYFVTWHCRRTCFFFFLSFSVFICISPIAFRFPSYSFCKLIFHSEYEIIMECVPLVSLNKQRKNMEKWPVYLKNQMPCTLIMWQCHV